MTERLERGAQARKLWERAGFFRTFLEGCTDLLVVISPGGELVHANAGARRLLGLAPDAPLGGVFERLHPEDREAARERLRRFVTGDADRCDYEGRVLIASGDERRFAWSVQRVVGQEGRIDAIAALGRDVSEERRQSDSVAANAERWKALVAGMLDPVIIIDPYGTVLVQSRSVTEVFGYEPGELIGRNIRVLMPEPHGSRHDSYLEKYRSTGETWILNTTRQFEVLRKDGQPITCELSVSRVDVPGEPAPIFCGSFRDVTERIRSQHELALSERRFRAIFDQEYQFVGLLEPSGNVLEANQAALQAAGLTRARVVGVPFWETSWWGHSEEDRIRLRRAVADAAEGRFVRFETSVVDRERRAMTIDFSIKPILDDDGHVILLLPEGRNVTPLKEAQRRETSMLRALAAIGESASVLAHEIKNPITGINLALRAVADQLGEDQKVLLEDLVSRMQKLEQTMRRTLSFARPLDLKLDDCEPAGLARSVAATLQPHFDRCGVALEVVVARESPQLEADPLLIEEVLINLCRNGLEAVQQPGGRVRLTVEPDHGDVSFRVEDDGPGIAKSQLPQLFKPFCTTKALGTGLGLAVCKKIVEAHGGTIEAGSSELGGAAFRVRLPAEP